MKRKMIALFLIFTMLASLSPAVAADATSAPPMVEEILSEYHQKAFEAQTRGETDATSTWSRWGGSTKTLEQETVDTLTAAGYEAYNVTADNYETLEAELKTDFAGMGLDPEGSYIVVIHGEDPGETTPTSGQSTFSLSPIPEEVQLPSDGDGSTYFEYTHDGTTYYMRYVTIIPTTQNGMTEESDYAVQPDMFWENTFGEIVNTGLVSLAEKAIEEASEKAVPLGLVFSILEDWFTDENFRVLGPGNITILADSSWTCNLIQIWTASTNCWDTAQCSEYVLSSAYLTRLVDDPIAQRPVRQFSDPYTCTHYSPKFFNSSQRIAEAIDHYDRVHSFIAFDPVYSVSFFFEKANGEILWEADGKPLFTHERSFSIPISSYE